MGTDIFMVRSGAQHCVSNHEARALGLARSGQSEKLWPSSFETRRKMRRSSG